MADLIVNLKFVNVDAIPKIEKIRVEQSAVSRIMDWYGAFYAGDDYHVYINNRLQAMGINGELEPVTIDATATRTSRSKLLKIQGGDGNG